MPYAPFTRIPFRALSHSFVLLVVGLLSLRLDVEARANFKIARQASVQENFENKAQDRRAAEQLLAEADKLKTKKGLESSFASLEKLEQAATKFQAANAPLAELDILRRIGQLQQRLNESQEAFASFSRALTLSKRLKEVEREIDLLNDIGQLAVDLGDDSRAFDHATRARTLSENSRNSSGIARALNILGDVHYNRGELQESLVCYQQSLRMSHDLRNRIGEIRALVSFGYAYLDLSEQRKALDSYEQALSLCRTEGDSYWEAITLRALGNLETKLGENQKAIDFFLKALNISQSLDDRHLTAIVLAGLGYAYGEVGEKSRALEYYNRALVIFKAINHLWGESETRMDAAGVYFSLGDNQEAMNNYNRALDLFRTLRMPRYQAQTLRGMGLVYESMGEKSKALFSFKRALALTRAGQDQRYEAYTLNYLGRAYDQAGEKQRARSYYQQALRLNRVASDPAGESMTLFNIAHLERDVGNLHEARASIGRAHEIIESLRTKSTSQDLRAAYFATIRRHYELYIDILMRLHQEAPTEGFDAQAFQQSEKARARSLLESLTENRSEIREGVDNTLLERERSLQQTLNVKAERYAQLKNGKNSADELEVVARDIDQITIEYDEVRSQIRSQSPHYAALTQPQPLTLKETQQQVLDDNSLLLEYMLGDERSYVWAVSRTEVTTCVLPGRADIEKQSRTLSSLITASQPLPGESFGQTQARVAKANEQLPAQIALVSRLLLQPVASRLGTKRLLIVPDGALQYIPFQILTASVQINPEGSETAKLRPLVLDHEIVNEPSASTLALLISDTTARRQAAKTVAVFADPVFEADDPRIKSAKPMSNSGATQLQEPETRRALRDVGLVNQGGHIPRLQASRVEADAIMSVTPWRSGFEATGFEANRITAMRPDLSNYRVVHFATHGLLNDEHPELSGVVLSLFDENGQPQDGFLRLHDIYNLKLPVDLVVLSACNTGLGKDVKGEGLIGLTRGFMYAGASSVVASLWKVDDEATAELMRYFYGFMLKDGLAPAAALRKAQVTMSEQKRWQSPYYWSGFIIQGQYLQNESMKVSHVTSLTVLGGASALLIIAAFLVLKRRRRRIL